MRYPFNPGESFFLIESGETIMHQGKLCSMLVKSPCAPPCLVQPSVEYMYGEDGVVYFWSDVVNDFQILFDFNALNENMWRICVEDYPPGYNVDSIRVHVVNTWILEINGEELRYIKLTYIPSYFSPQYWIDSVLERIGSVNLIYSTFILLSL
jgi:hypothetical protein